MKPIRQAEIDRFLDDIERISRLHQLSISHEDYQGAFIIERFTEKNLAWFRDAYTSELLGEDLEKADKP